MANVRWKDKTDIATLAATDRIPVTDDVAGAAIDKYCTPAEIKTYVFSGAFSLNGKLTGGTNEIEGSNFDINGGTINDVTIIDGDQLQIDNINVNGNSITSTDANGDITIDPNGTGDINLTTAGGFVVLTQGDLKIGATAVTASGAELNHVVGVTSAIQTQLTAKAPIADPTFTGEIGIGAVNVSETELGILEGATVTTAELNHVVGVTSAIQTQLTAKAPIADPTFTGEIGIGAVNVSETELGILEGATVTTAELNLLDAGSTEAVYDNGANIVVRIVGVGQVTFNDGSILPVTDDDIDLGSAAQQFKNGYFDGTLEADAITRNGFKVADIDNSVSINTVAVDQAAPYNAAGAGYYSITTATSDISFYCPLIGGGAYAGQEIIVYHTAAGNTLRIRSDGEDAGFTMLTGDDTQATGTLITMTTANDFVILKCSGGHGGRWAIIGGYGVDLS